MRSNRWLCPVTYFLALALGDDVFNENISHPSQLARLEIPTGRNSLSLSYKPQQAKWPILRAYTAQRPSITNPSTPRILRITRLCADTREAGMRAKFGKKLTNYAWRRGQGMKVHGKSTSSVSIDLSVLLPLLTLC